MSRSLLGTELRDSFEKMQARISKLTQTLRILKYHGRRGLARAFVLTRRLWRRLDAVDIPLSPLQWVLLFYFVFGALYLGATPVFEANDEIWHFGFVQHVREQGSLPVQQFDGRDTLYQQHGSQPPLYYYLMALLTSPIEIDDSDQYRLLNPHVNALQPESFGNKNLIIHDATLSILRGTGLAVLVIRALGLALGAATIVLVFKVGELIAPQRPTVAFVAAALTGLNPMFIFVSASVNNDSLAMLLNGALVWLLLRTLRDGFRLRYSIVIALLFALSCLTKLTAFALLPLCVGAAYFAQRRTNDRRGALIFFSLAVVLWLLVAGWWFVRSVQTYGEPLGIITMANIAGPRGITFNLVDVFADFQQFRMSFWGLFGALNIQVTSIFYVLLDVMTFLSFIGFVFLILQLLAISDFAYARYELAHLLSLASALAFAVAGILYWSTLTRTVEGRMLFPLIAVVIPLLAVGLVEIVWWIVFSLRPPNLEFVRAGDAVPVELLHDAMVWQLRVLGTVALLAPLTVIAGQYAAPQPVPEVPDKALPVYAEFGNVTLVAYERVDRRYSPGDRVRLKLYWRVAAQSPTDNSVLLRLVDDNQQEIGRYTTFPGAGSLRTSRWQAGAIYPDEYVIHISNKAYGRYPFDLNVEWGDLANEADIPAIDSGGRSIEPVLLDIGAVVAPLSHAVTAAANNIPSELQPKFDDSILLESFQLELELNEIILNWKTESAPSENYTVFAHMLDEEGNIIAQADASPRLPTEYWRWGESYRTYHRFPSDLSMIDYRVSVGLYINDGLAYPRAEYRVTAPAGEVDAEEADDAVASAVPEGDSDLLEEQDQDSETEQVEVIRDTYTIPWDIASEVLALTPTPEPTADGDTEVRAGEAEIEPTEDAAADSDI